MKPSGTPVTSGPRPLEAIGSNRNATSCPSILAIRSRSSAAASSRPSGRGSSSSSPSGTRTSGIRPRRARADLPADVSAWLHRRTWPRHRHTGKTEIGQNIRTSLSQAVADELRLPVSAVTLVMADTDHAVRPGTFGSRRRRRWRARLSRAAATAREMLIDQAASLATDRATLSEGRRIVSADGKSIEYGELTKGEAGGTVAPRPA